MKKLFSRRPTPALGVAVLALFISLGGVSYGVATGSIDGREIRNNTVRTQDLRNNDIRGKDVRTGTLGGSDVQNDALRGLDINESSLGKVPSAVAADRATSASTADRLGGRDASGFTTRWALVNEAGVIEQQTGGFTLVDCFQTNANCYIDAGEDVRNNGLDAEIAIANTDGSARLSGETGTAPCGATFVACAPPNTEFNNVIVVAPRDSAGTAAPADNRFRFYVFVTGSESTTP